MLNIAKINFKRVAGWPTNRPAENVIEDLELVFIHIPKTGGTSIRKVLEPLGPSRDRYPGLGKHEPARIMRASIGRRKWDRYCSFAVVRNPWDWAVSSYHWWTQIAARHVSLVERVDSIQKMGSFRNFVRSDYFKYYIHEFQAKDYAEWIVDNGKILVTDVLKFESLDKDWKQLVNKYQLPLEALPHLNVSKRVGYQSYYDEETAKLVADKFSASIDLFGYTFESQE
ncbi:MAG TPA: hypothetical protein DCX06_03525 [Opitutae bacterium]|nr:hypothetical protein [Opitutae bacterium]